MGLESPFLCFLMELIQIFLLFANSIVMLSERNINLG